MAGVKAGTHRCILAAAALGAAIAAAPLARAQGVSYQEVLKLEAPAADERISYGPAPQQFGDLWLPRAPGPHPVAILLHGGCWRALYDSAHVRPVAGALARAGIAVWSLEYRRIGDGGGWPGTFEDVAHGADRLRPLALRHRLDLSRVVAVGHSASWASPAALLPLGVPQRLVHGRQDRIVPLVESERYLTAAVAKGDAATLVAIDEAGHFDLIAPPSKAWRAVEQAVQSLLK